MSSTESESAADTAMFATPMIVISMCAASRRVGE
jgi:hypothetical protein